MRLVRMAEFGGPEVLRVEQAPDPVSGAGRVLVEVVWAAITFVETQVRAGNAPWPVRVPLVPGGGVAGVVTAVGEGVGGELLGLAVAVSTGGSGGYAERVVVDAAEAVVVPDGVGLDEAAALIADGRTAVLNPAAAGSVVGGPLGRAAYGVLRSGGLMVGYGRASGEWAAVDPDDAARRGIELVRPERPTPERIGAAFREALRHAAEGTLAPVVGQWFPLERAADAHAAVEARRTVGKTLLRVG